MEETEGREEDQEQSEELAKSCGYRGHSEKEPMHFILMFDSSNPLKNTHSYLSAHSEPINKPTTVDAPDTKLTKCPLLLLL